MWIIYEHVYVRAFTQINRQIFHAFQLMRSFNYNTTSNNSKDETWPMWRMEFENETEINELLLSENYMFFITDWRS